VLRLSPELFWSGFFPFDYVAGRRTRWLPLFAAFPSLLVLGLAGRRRPRRLAAALVVSLILAPLAAGISLPGWFFLTAALAMVGIGGFVAKALGL
jgi:hypothetical protein